MAPFTGFPKEAFKFLHNVAKHNDKRWFDAHREDYEACLLEPSKAFVEDIGGALRAIAPDIIAEPRVNGSIRRINRDIRFSKDKRPYKDHWDFHFPEGRRETCSTSSYMLRLTGDRVHVVAGSHEFSKPSLQVFRDAIANGAGEELDGIVRKLVKNGYTVGHVGYTKIPRGYDSNGAYSDFLLYSGLYAVWSGPVPAEAHSPKFTAWCIKHYRKLKPLHEWLKSTLN